MYRLFVAAIAMMFSVGCHAVCKIFLVKSKLSTLMSSFLLLPPTQTLRGLRIARGLLLSRDASKVTSRLVFRSNIRKKLLYAPVIITLQRERKKGKTKTVKQQLAGSLLTWPDEESWTLTWGYNIFWFQLGKSIKQDFPQHSPDCLPLPYYSVKTTVTPKIPSWCMHKCQDPDTMRVTSQNNKGDF